MTLAILLALFLNISEAKDFCRPNASYEATVTDITDGDTVKVKEKKTGSILKIRVLNIDAPETHYQGQSQEPWGQMSADYMAKILPVGASVSVKTDVEACDMYKRLLGTIFYKGESINLKMVADGYAFPYIIYPNIKSHEEILSYAEQAYEKGLMVYSAEGLEIPFVFRRRIAGTKPNRYVGDISKKCYVAPADWEKVPVYDAIFFSTATEAKNFGMTRCID